MCTHLVTLTVACLVQTVSWPCFDVNSSGDTDCGLSCSESELALFLMCTVLVTLTVACLVQYVSQPGFKVYSSGDTECGLPCFRE